MFIETKFALGDEVYLITDPEQSKRMVTRFQVGPNGVTYCLSYGVTETWHFAMEISEEKILVT